MAARHPFKELVAGFACGIFQRKFLLGSKALDLGTANKNFQSPLASLFIDEGRVLARFLAAQFMVKVGNADLQFQQRGKPRHHFQQCHGISTAADGNQHRLLPQQHIVLACVGAHFLLAFLNKRRW